MRVFTVQFSDEEYRIVGPNGEEGALVPIGSPAFITVRGQRYMAFVDTHPDDTGEGDPLLPEPEQQLDPIKASVFLLGPEQQTVFEEAEFVDPEAEAEPETEDEVEAEEADADDTDDTEEVVVEDNDNEEQES